MNSADGAALSVQFAHRQGNLEMDVAFALQRPWTVLFGPSGSGKTTVLRTIAGFVKPADAKIVAFETKVLQDRAAKVFVEPHLRPVRSAAQGARLFPHMTIRENVLFGAGARVQTMGGADLIEEVFSLFDLAVMRDRMPRELSGGEAQKAAVARAVASAVTGAKRNILLLDEPFNGLDLRVRDELVARLKDWLKTRRIPVLSVTHDVAEAFQLGAEVIKIADGKVVQQGPVEVVLAAERRRLLTQLGDFTTQSEVGYAEPTSSEPYLGG